MSIITNRYKAYQVKSLISAGNTKLAIDLLYEHCLNHHPFLYDSALMLYNGIIKLEQDLATGAISLNDAEAEEKKLKEEVLNLANQFS
ncbi:MAG: hypothetical protein IT258_11185, partial [Saprospiraceae bacterium]|nr:hypothetical protein [Saprospiraceae bacterium]